MKRLEGYEISTIVPSEYKKEKCFNFDKNSNINYLRKKMIEYLTLLPQNVQVIQRSCLAS